MTIYITGDTHGDIVPRFSFSKNPQFKDITSEDYVVILGDWGGVWNYQTKKEIKHTKYILNWMREKPWKWICLLGNHDNWDWALSLPPKETEIGKVRTCSFDNQDYDNIYIVAEPSILHIEGKQCFCIPGAECHDGTSYCIDENGNYHNNLLIYHPNGNYFSFMPNHVTEQTERITKKFRNRAILPKYFRIEGVSWWKEEPIDIDSAGEILYYLTDNDCRIDYVFSHDAPAIQIEEINKQLPNGYKEIYTEGELFLDQVREKLNFNQWYHGHLHYNNFQNKIDNRIICLYESVIKKED